MSDPYYNAVPPGQYWDEDDRERLENAERDEELNKSWADMVTDAAIEEYLMNRKEKNRGL